jgi:hypothetical protein
MTRSITPGGLPYPESSAPANQGANDIKALALAVDARGVGKLTQSGHISMTSTNANGSITWPQPFKAGTVPTMLLAGNVPNTIVFLAAGAGSATGCAVTVFELWPNVRLSVGTLQVDVSFIAIGDAP